MASLHEIELTDSVEETIDNVSDLPFGPAMVLHFVELPNLIQQDFTVKVWGNIIALQALQTAFNERGMMLSPHTPTAAFMAIVESTHMLIATNKLPALNISRAVQLGQADLQESLNTSVQFISYPPFNFEVLNVDEALAYLRICAEVQGPGAVYQLGIVTHYNAFTVAELFPMTHGTPISSGVKTIWVYRTCTPSFVSFTGFDEEWKAFRGYAHPFPTNQHFSQHIYLPGQIVPMAQVSHPGHNLSTATTTYPTYSTPQGIIPSTSTIRPSLPVWSTLKPGQWVRGTVAPKAGRRGPKASWNNLFLLNGYPIDAVIDDILAGAVHPDDMCGLLIIEMAKVRSNAQIKDAMHQLYEVAPDVGHVPDKDGAFLTKLITMALKAKAGKDAQRCPADDPDYLAERHALNETRRKNKVKFHCTFAAPADQEE